MLTMILDISRKSSSNISSNACQLVRVTVMSDTVNSSSMERCRTYTNLTPKVQ